LQVFNSVVNWIAIDVMHVFMSFQLPAKMNLHYMAMLSDVLAINFDDSVFFQGAFK